MKYKQGPHKNLACEKAPKHLSPSVAAKGGVIGAVCVVNTSRNEPRARGAERPAAPLSLSSYFFSIEKDLPRRSAKGIGKSLRAEEPRAWKRPSAQKRRRHRKVPPRRSAKGMEKTFRAEVPKASEIPSALKRRGHRKDLPCRSAKGMESPIAQKPKAKAT